MAERKAYAVYAITKHGLELAQKIREALPQADLYVSERFRERAPADSLPLGLPMGPTLRSTFQAYNCHIHVISVGAVVRMIAPLLVDKKVDPAVLCVDDAGRFVVCLLSGHVGRGNAFTQQVADILGARPVVTTASDVNGTLTVDILGREFGWQLDDPSRNVTAGCAAVVNQAPVALVQECGEPDFWPLERALPPGVRYFASLDQVDPEAFEMLLIVSDRLLERSHPHHWQRAVIYRPRSLVVGLGCDRGTPVELLERGLRHWLAEAGLDRRCVRGVATIDVKGDEPGIQQLCQRHGWPLSVYSAAQLDAVEGVETPSAVVKRYVGTRSVAEAACLLGAQASRLQLSKRKFGDAAVGRNMTLAVARYTFSRRGEVRIDGRTDREPSGRTDGPVAGHSEGRTQGGEHAG